MAELLKEYEDFLKNYEAEEIYNAKWQDDVIGIAVENGDVELSQNGTERKRFI